MKVLDLIAPKRIDRVPDKTIVLLSSGNYEEQDFIITHVELRLYLQKKDKKLGSYSIITSFVETKKGNSIEMIFTEGYKGPNALEEAAAYVTSHPALSALILNSVLKLKKEIDSSYEKNMIEKRMEILIEIMKKDGFLTQKRVEDALKNTPRHLFVPPNFVEQAYEDIPLPTKEQQTISQPRVVAKMTEWLDVKEGNKVLEIGCGSGWQSAILSHLVGGGTVYSIERSGKLVEFAKENHQRVGIKNIKIIYGDGTLGIPENSPFDRIIITASCKKVPQPLLDQLAPDGLLVAPVGELWQSLTLLRKTSDGIKEEKKEFGYIFAPLIGKFGFKKNPWLSI